MMTCDIGLKLIVLHTQLMERRTRVHFTWHSASGEWQTWQRTDWYQISRWLDCDSSLPQQRRI